MHIEYTPEEVRTLIAEHEALDFTTPGGATADDLAEATDVLEGFEELIGKLDPTIRYETVNPYSIPVGAEGDLAWIPVANNCTRSAGLTVATDGALDFAVRPESGQNISYYFAARRAVAHALVGSQEDEVETARHEDPLDEDPSGEDPLVELLKESGWAVAAGRTIADVDDEVLARAYRLSEEGIAHLFATEAGDGLVLAMAGSTQGDRRRAVEALPVLPGRSYSPRPYSVMGDSGEDGGKCEAPSRLNLVPQKPATPRAWPYLSGPDFARITSLLGESVEDPGTPQERLGSLVGLVAGRMLASLTKADPKPWDGAQAVRHLIGPFALSGGSAADTDAVGDAVGGTIARLALAKLSRAGEVRLFLEKTTGHQIAALPDAGEEAVRNVFRNRLTPQNASAKSEEHYSEKEGFGQTIKEAPKPKEHLLVAAAERFKASRFVRPSSEKPLDTEGIRQRVRKVVGRAAIRYVLAVDPADAGELVRRVAAVHLVARYVSQETIRRSLAAEKPWDSKAERKRMVDTGRRIRSKILADRKARKARGGRKLPVWSANTLDLVIDARLGKGSETSTEEQELRDSIEQRTKSGRAAYDTARAVYLQRCPDLEHKLLHLLRRDGVKAEAKFLARHSNLAAEATNPEGALRAALRTLAESGKVRRVRSQKTGEVFLTTTEPLDETGYRRSLNGLIRNERYGIVNPWTEASPVEADGETGEWEKGLEDLDQHEAAILAPKRFRNTEASEQQLIAAEEVAEYSAFEEVEAVVEGFAENIA